MGRIALLDELTINKIAAGEVVERPSSVVKELLENALDAGATHIQIKIENGGRSLIQIIDDGCGMDRDDAVLSLERHATSKIKNVDDLSSLMTMGFRGEALPSIAAVSELLLETATEDGNGTLIRCENGRIAVVQSAGLPKGTRITVRDLFENTPARLKYLKSITTETAHIKETVANLAMANPDVSFKLYHHDMEILFSPGDGDLRQTIAAIFGGEIAKQLIAVEGWQGPLKINGYIGRPMIARSNRNQEIVIMNGRWIRSRTVGSAVEKAFHTFLTVGRYPFFVLNLQIDMDLVDVNVHPAKMEVRFLNESEVFRQVFHSVREALSSGMTTASWEETTGRKTVETPHIPSPPSYSAPKPSSTPLFIREPAATVEWIAPTVQDPMDKDDQDYYRQPTPGEAPLTPSTSAPTDTILDFNYLIYDRTYIITLEPDGILLTDQHAAHERILYERIKKRAETGGSRGQLLLQPLVVEVSPEEEGVLERASTVLTEAGFEIEGFGASTVLLRGIPMESNADDASAMLHQILEELLTGVSGSGQSMRDRVFASLACHNAIKAEDVIGKLEVQALLKDLSACQNPKTCPHGRPTQIKIMKDEILRMFRRI